jgi:hypothetical protein
MTELQECRQVAMDRPFLPLRAVSVTGRIENDGIILIAAFNLALTEFDSILDHPANRRIRQA